MAGEADQQGVAVGRRLGDRIRRKVATGTGTVLDSTGRPRDDASGGAIARAIVSVVPPGEAPTMSLIGRDG